MFQSLSERLESAFKNIKGEGRITELNIAATVKDIRRALVDADVNFKIAKEFTDDVKEKAIGSKVLLSVNPGQQMVKIVQDALTDLMGGTASDLGITGAPAVILIAGLQGSGKTTFSGKLAKYLKTQKKIYTLLMKDKILTQHEAIHVYKELGILKPDDLKHFTEKDINSIKKLTKEKKGQLWELIEDIRNGEKKTSSSSS
jgi:signal recognition particle subunit SRP54